MVDEFLRTDEVPARHNLISPEIRDAASLFYPVAETAA